VSSVVPVEKSTQIERNEGLLTTLTRGGGGVGARIIKESRGKRI
jgi:hypothetical protein